MLSTAVFVFLAFSAITAGSGTASNSSQHTDNHLSDEVNLIQTLMSMGSHPNKLTGVMPQADRLVLGIASGTEGSPIPWFNNHTDEPDSAFARVASVQLNAAGDLPAFLAALQFDIELVVFFIVVFVVLSRYFPNVYAFRATGAGLEGKKQQEAKTAPFVWPADERSWTYWAWYAFAPTHQQLIDSCGLDAAMLLAFTEMALEILFFIGLPFILLLCPAFAFLGGHAAGHDRLSIIGIGNVQLDSWIFWPVSATSWYVVIFTQYRLYVWMKYFIKFREDYLLSMPHPQRQTLLVDGIPDELCSDAALKAYFSRMYDRSKSDQAIKGVYVVKKMHKLEDKVEEFRQKDRLLKELKYWMKNNPDQPCPKTFTIQGRKDQDEYYESELERLAEEIKVEQERVAEEAKKAPDETQIYATSGFVVFEDRKIAEQALNTRLRIADDEIVLSYPPEPNDVIWKDLEQTVAARTTNHVLGYAAIAGLFFAFMPIVLAISQACNLDSLEQKFPWMKDFTNALGSYRDTLAGTLASIGLTLMMSFLPTLLMFIFTSFFTLKAHRWAQLYCQTYYFWFLVLFVLLVTAIGSSLSNFVSEIAQSPFLIFGIIAEELPLTTHFYMNWVVLQWTTHAMNLTRYINLGKYLIYKPMMDPEDARAMSEPEDQDYYGMGSRSARFAFVLVLALVFSSICPLLIVLAWLNFLICRLIYGYLIPYAEGKKKDLGGAHFALQLLHVHLGLLIYIILMTGLMVQRGTSWGPAAISATTFLWWAIGFNTFRTKLHYENLCYEEVVDRADEIPLRKTDGVYQQTALNPDVVQQIKDDPYMN
mmetsp:Transcript_149497/g.272137  ORF Transcript_149497/g.272137 Transcript_149497/m.272137 type:complete len:818 (+) Transcript_149497:86-2539(+)